MSRAVDASPETLLQAVTDVARAAGDAALAHFGRLRAGDVETKSDGSPVTVADRAAETVARELVARLFPDDGVVGEEFGATGVAARRRWVIDPIDGTKSFVRGVPLWTTLVGVAEGDRVVAGAIYAPAASEIVAAAAGTGAWWNGARCRVSDQQQVSAATVLTTDTEFMHAPPGERAARRAGWERVAGRAAVVRTWGDGYGYLLVATGRADVMCDAVMNVWDTAALGPVVREAGGVFTDWDGAPTELGASAVATNAALAREVRDILRNAPA